MSGGGRRYAIARGAHASRVLVRASRLHELCLWEKGRMLFVEGVIAWVGKHRCVLAPPPLNLWTKDKVRFGGTPKPARETRALPGTMAAVIDAPLHATELLVTIAFPIRRLGTRRGDCARRAVGTTLTALEGTLWWARL